MVVHRRVPCISAYGNLYVPLARTHTHTHTHTLSLARSLAHLLAHRTQAKLMATEKKLVVVHRLHQILVPFMLRRQVCDLCLIWM